MSRIGQDAVTTCMAYAESLLATARKLRETARDDAATEEARRLTFQQEPK